mmetsp:Transcript_13568/g.41031  ORF Transcript_13568/g.41031 Transcript_13568/m.41031 type:complete len:125 (-) Transcript_13568:1251-1625(-)
MASSSRGGAYKTRPGQDHVQIGIDSGNDYDLDADIDGLSSQVSRLKQVAGAIHEEQNVQNGILSNLEETMEQARLGLSTTMKRLSRTIQGSKSNHLLYLLLFAVGVMAALWLLTKAYRIVRWVV